MVAERPCSVATADASRFVMSLGSGYRATWHRALRLWGDGSQGSMGAGHPVVRRRHGRQRRRRDYP